MAQLEATLAASETADQSARPAVIPGLLDVLESVLGISADMRISLIQLALVSRAAVAIARV